jgi:sugar/nucleoside kinase (ribokinase family)
VTRRLLCAGEVVVDLVLPVPALPERGGDVIAHGATAEVGGAFNVMAAAARQGVPVTYAGLVGTGPMAELVTAALRREGIGVALRPRPGADTGTIVTMVEPDGERTFVTTLGAEAQLGEEDLAAVAVRPDDIVHVSGYGLAYPCNGPNLARWVAALPTTVTVVLDPGPLVAGIAPALLSAVLDRCDWISASAREARLLCRGPRGDEVAEPAAADDDIAAALGLATELRSRVRAGVVVRLGERGAVVVADAAATHVPAVVVEAVDRNGAGDAHVGSLVASLSAPGFDATRAVSRANRAAALAVTRRGPATAPTTAELDSPFDMSTTDDVGTVDLDGSLNDGDVPGPGMR